MALLLFGRSVSDLLLFGVNTEPFHSIETISAYKVKGKELQTGLPEYRNAGLLTDFGVFNPKLEAFANTSNVTKPISMHDLPPLGAAHPGIIEWRALTVVYLDRIHEAVCKEFGAQLSLAQVRVLQILERATDACEHRRSWRRARGRQSVFFSRRGDDSHSNCLLYREEKSLSKSVHLEALPSTFSATVQFFKWDAQPRCL